MGAIQKIRSQSTLLIVFIAIALLCFIIPWGEVMDFVNMKKDKAFAVDGEVVKTKQYADQVAIEQEMYETFSGNLNETQVGQLRESVFQTMVNEVILDRETSKIGLRLTEQEFNNMLVNVQPDSYLYYVPYFRDPQTNEFSIQAMHEFINFANQPLSSNSQMRSQQLQVGAIWDNIANRIRLENLQDKYTTMVLKGIVVNELEINDYIENNSPEANLAYVKINSNVIPDADVNVSKDEIQRLYNERSKEIFKSTYPTRTITYLEQEILPSEEDKKVAYDDALEAVQELTETNEDIATIVNNYSSTPYNNAFIALDKIRNKNVQDFIKNAKIGDVDGPIEDGRGYSIYKYVAKTVAPDTISVQVLPLTGMQALEQTTVQTVDSLLQVINKGGSFDEIISSYYPSNPQLLLPQAITEEALANVVDNASKIFDASVGSVHQLTIQMTPALLKVVSKTKPVEKVKLAYIYIPIDISETTFHDVDNKINALISEVGKNVKSFAEIASAQGYDVREGVVVQPNFANIDNIEGTRPLIKWAFNDKKSDSKLETFDLPESRIVAVVTGETKTGYLTTSNEMVDEILKNYLVTQKKNEIIERKIYEINPTTLEQLTDNFDVIVDSVNFVSYNTNSVDYPLAVWSKVGNENTLSNPQIGHNGVYVMKLLHQQKNPTILTNQIVESNIIDIYGIMRGNGALLTQILVNKSNIDDNRVEFF